MSRFYRFLLIFVLILLLGVGGTGWWFYQRNQSSKGDLILELLGPDSVTAGQEVEYTLRCRNQGLATIVQPELLFTFPAHAQPVDSEEAIIRKELDSIYPGQERVLTFKARLFGPVGEIEQAQAKIDYRLKGLKAYYSSETQLATPINNVPLTFEFDLPNSIPPQEDFQFFINYASNFDQPISGLAIQLDSPVDFEITSIEPEGIEQKKWNLPILLKKEGGQIKITGKMNQEAGEQEMFQAHLGVWTQDQFVLLKNIQQTIQIARSSVYLSQQINGRLDYVATAGDFLHYQIFFRNVSDYPLEKQFLVVKLNGNEFDLDSLMSKDGLYQPGDNSILWDWKTISSLRFLDKQKEGSVEFWINLKEDWIASSQSPEVENIVSIDQSRRVFAVKVNSSLGLIQKAYHGNEFFEDKGPIPFEMGKTSAYTIFWQASNTYNEARNIKVQTILPKGIWFNYQSFPVEEGSNLDYDTLTNKLIWNIGQLDPGQKATVAFQLSLTPQNQSDLQLPLIDTSSISGMDQWTKEAITTQASIVKDLSTILKNES